MKMNNFNNFDFNIGIRIRNQRENLGYSREKLAELAGMSAGYLGEVERGTKGISSFFLYNISLSLGITMDHLVSDEQNSHDSMSKEFETILNLLYISKDTDLKLIEKIIRAIIIDN